MESTNHTLIKKLLHTQKKEFEDSNDKKYWEIRD